MKQTCVYNWCQKSFEITKDDLEFYTKVSPIFNGVKYQIPPPIYCPECRQQKRMIWRNERTLYKRTCDMTGANIISCFPKDSIYTVYSQEAYWSDAWDPRDFAQDVDFSKTFFDQFDTLLKKVPHIALLNMKTENSDYCHRIYDGRNNYLSIIALYAPENLLYTYYTMACKDCTDTAFNQYSELCYEVVDTEKCYQCKYSLRLNNCTDCYFCEDCIGCKNCYGCKNLRQKEYCIYNEQKTKNEYESFINECRFNSYSFIQNAKKACSDFMVEHPQRSNVYIDTQNVTGGNVYHCQNSSELYDWYESERMTHCALGEKSHDCMDIYGMGVGDFCLEAVTNMYVHHALFSVSSANVADILYCYESSSNTSDCFGCASMKKGKYCILNKQYSKDDYEMMCGKLVDHMKQTGEWGQFFPPEISPTAYNESVAQDYYPLTEQKAIDQGYRWQHISDDVSGTTKKINADLLPDSLHDVPDDIVNWSIECSSSKRPFRIIKQELEYYRKHEIPIPRLHPDERHRLRVQKRNPRKMWDRNCQKCKNKISSTYSPDKKEIVFCEECYLKEVY